jgi:hypothetical protein
MMKLNQLSIIYLVVLDGTQKSAGITPDVCTPNPFIKGKQIHPGGSAQ